VVAAATPLPTLYPSAPTRIAIEAVPIATFDVRDNTRVRFGQLEFRGGLQLSSAFKPFGGISGLQVAPDGAHFLAVTDRGAWLRGRIVYRDGRLAGIADAEMAPILGADGKPLAARGWYDTESLTERDGRHYVGIERVEQIVRLDYRRHGFDARAEPIPVPPDFAKFTSNKGLECLAALPGSAGQQAALLAVAERHLDGGGNHRGFILRGAHVTRFSITRSDDFDVGDCALLPGGELLLLERRYSVARGVAMRIRRIALAGLKAGAALDGPPAIYADLGNQIDNMEAIALHRNAQGETILTLMSDNNFSGFQRTLLLQFALMGE
jgi:hypothetical protein